MKNENTLKLRIADMPEVLAGIRNEMAKLLRDEADSESDPRIARRLRELAAIFEAGCRL